MDLRMTAQEQAICRACIEQAQLGLTELREVRSFWGWLSDARQRELKEFMASLSMYYAVLRE